MLRRRLHHGGSLLSQLQLPPRALLRRGRALILLRVEEAEHRNRLLLAHTAARGQRPQPDAGDVLTASRARADVVGAAAAEHDVAARPERDAPAHLAAREAAVGVALAAMSAYSESIMQLPEPDSDDEDHDHSHFHAGSISSSDSEDDKNK